MRRLVVLVTMLTGCLFGGGGDDGGGVSGKSWQPAQTSLMDQQTSFAWGAGDKLFSTGLDTKHVVALDPATLLYDDYGVPPKMGGAVVSGDSGTVYLVGGDPSDVYRLDDRTWTKIEGSSGANLTIGPGDLVYDTDTGTTPGMTIITRHPLGDWTSPREMVATIAGNFTVAVDARGHLLGLSRDDERINGTIEGGAFHPLYDCGTIQQPWCTNRPRDLQLDDDGTLTFVTVNDITGSRIYRKAPGADPVEAAPMPTPEHDNAYHVFSAVSTADGTRYLAYGGNDLDSPHLYVLAHGATSFTEAPKLPDGAYGCGVSPHGLVTAMSGTPIRGWFLK